MKSFKEHLAETKDSVVKDKSGKAVSWKHEGDWHPASSHKDEFGNPIKKVAKHLAKKGQKGPVVPVDEDWGSSDTSAAMRIMWDTINSEFGGKLSIESMTSGAERAAELYQDSLGLDFKEATNTFLGYFMRRPDGVAFERHQKNKALNESNGTPFQIKIGASWEDVVLESHDLEQLADEFYSDADMVKKSSNDMATIHAMVKTYYLGAQDSSIDEDYEVQSVDADMLKIAFWFTSDNDRMKKIKGTITILPANENMGIAGDADQLDEAVPEQIYFKLLSNRAKSIMQDMRDVDELQSLNSHGEVMSASAEDVAALRSKLIQNGQIDAFESVVEESPPVPASQEEVVDEANGRLPAARLGLKQNPGATTFDRDFALKQGVPGAETGAWCDGAIFGYAEGREAGYSAGYDAGYNDAGNDESN